MINDFIAYADQNGITMIAALALLDLILGVSVAISKGEFKLFYVGNILQKLAPMLVSYVAVTMLLGNPAVAVAVFTVAAAQFTGSIMKNLGFLFPALTEYMPDALIQPEWHRAGYNAATEARIERMNRQTR